MGMLGVFDKFWRCELGYSLGEINAQGKFIPDFLLSSNLTLGKQKGVLLHTRVRCHVFREMYFLLVIMTIRFDELKVLPGESLTIQHIVLVIDARVKRRERRGDATVGIQGSNGGI